MDFSAAANDFGATPKSRSNSVDWTTTLKQSIDDPDPNVRKEMQARLRSMTPGLPANYAAGAEQQHASQPQPNAPYDFNQAANDFAQDVSKAPASPPGSATAAPVPFAKPTGVVNTIGAMTEPTIAAVTSPFRQVYAGLAGGLNTLVNGPEAGADTARDLSSYKPMTAGGQYAIEGLKNTAAPVAQALTTPVQVGGQDVNPISRYATGNDQLADAGHPIAATVRGLLPQALGLAAGGASRIGGGLDAAFGERAAMPVSARVEPSLTPKPTTPPGTPKPTAPPVAPGYVPSAPEPVAAPKFEALPAASATSGKLPAAARSARADTLTSIGLNPEQHPSAVTGDYKLAGQEFQESKLLGQVGDARKSIIDTEQNALRDNAEKIVSDTGGSPGVSPDTRGQSIIAPLKGLNDYFETQINKVYADARSAAGDLPAVNPTEFYAKLQDPDFRSELLSSPEGTSLLGQIDSQAKRFSLVGEGGAAPSTVNQAEQMRQWLNKVSKPSTGRPIGALKQAIDQDVASTGGENTFQFARDLYGIKKDTLDNPNGIASILNEEGPDGINRRVPFEKVPGKIVEMPNAQFGHVVNTLKNVPEELQPQAQQAINEIKAEMAERMVNAGTNNGAAINWRPNEFTKQANKFRDKIPMVFSDDEIAALKTQNDAGHILHRDKSYPGAEIQKQNLAVRGASASLPAAGASVGSFMAGPLGGAGGAAIGAAAARGVTKLADIGKAKAIRKGVPLSDLVGK